MTEWDVELRSRRGSETVRVEAADSEAALRMTYRPGSYAACITPVAARPVLTTKRKG